MLKNVKGMPCVRTDGCQVILKIHTKKSDHRLAGELWRNDLYNKLLKQTAIIKALEIFNSDHSAGLIGPVGHIVPMNLNYGANVKMVESLSFAMGVAQLHIPNLNFVAGSMFFARKQALMPLLRLNLQPDDFEEEKGQKDGTLAHAIERAFPISAHAINLKLVDTEYNMHKPHIIKTKDHPFTH